MSESGRGRRAGAMIRFAAGSLALFLVLIVLWLGASVVVPRAFGWKPLMLTSGSMAPALDPGDVILVAPPRRHPLPTGTVVSFEEGRGVVTHRIAGVNADGTYRTRGDANPGADSSPLRHEQIVGVARMRVPLLGRPALWLNERAWAPLLGIAAAVALVVWSMPFAVLERHNPWHAPAGGAPSERGAPPPSRRLRGLIGGRAAALLALILAFASGATAVAARAAFSDQVDNGPSALAAATSFCTAPTPTHLSGYENGPAGGSGTGLYDGIGTTGGIPVVDPAVKRNGGYALKIPKSSAGATYLDRSVGGSVLVQRFAISLDSLPAADVSQIAGAGVAAGSRLDLKFDAGSSRFELGFGANPPAAASTTVEAGTWYVLDVRVDLSSNPRVAAWRINGETQPQVSASEAASTVTTSRFGSDVTADVFTARIDDVMLSATQADYPIGDGKVTALRPDGMGTSSGASDFQQDDNSAIDSSSHLRVDDDPANSTGDFIKQVTSSAASFLELTFSDTTETCIRGVTALEAYHSSTGAANNGSASIFDGSAESVLFSGDMSETSINYRVAMVSPASSWSQSAVNGLVARIGRSTDASPQPSWDALLLQVETPP